MNCDGNQQGSSSSSSSSNLWLNLPREITVMILQKVGILHVLMSAQLVCTEWREICTDPSMWTTISLVDWKSYRITPQLKPVDYITHVENMIKRAVVQSCGSLFHLDLHELMSVQLLNYVVERCTGIRRLCGVPLECDVLEIMAPRLPLLEDLQLVGGYGVLSLEAIETLVRCCPRLRSLKSHVEHDAVEALLDGFPHLESMDLHIEIPYTYDFTGPLQMMMKKKLPLNKLNDPCTWSTIRVDISMTRFDFIPDSNLDVKDIIRRAVDKSCGRLVDVDLGIFIMFEDILSYIVERSTRIRRLRGCMISLDNAEKALCTAAPRLSHLESLQFTYNSDTFSAEIIQTLGRCCPKLTSLAIPIGTDEVAKTLARSFPQLRHLRPVVHVYMRTDKLTEVGVEALLDGCPHLESLDLRDCNHVRFDDTLAIRCAQQIKHLQRPMGYYCYSSSCCGLTEYQTTQEYDMSYEETKEEEEEDEDIYDTNYMTVRTEEGEDNMYDVNYRIDSIEEYSCRKGKVKGSDTHIRQLKKAKRNKNISNTIAERQKARRREFNSRRKAKKEFVH